jgi:hypothetical protein
MDGANAHANSSGGGNLMSPPAAKRPTTTTGATPSASAASGAPFMSPPTGGLPTPAARPAGAASASANGGGGIGGSSSSSSIARATPSAVSPGSLQSPPPASESGLAPGQAYKQRANAGQKVVEMNPNLAPRGPIQPSKRCVCCVDGYIYVDLSLCVCRFFVCVYQPDRSIDLRWSVRPAT